MQAHAGAVPMLHDTTVLDFLGRMTLNLSALGNGHGSGYLCHNSLTIDPASREVFGLKSQILHQRVSVGKTEGVKQKRERTTRASRLWSDAVAAFPAVGAWRAKEIDDKELETKRTAMLCVSHAVVEVLPAHVKKGNYEKKSIQAWAVRVWEESLPAKGTKLEWLLLCLTPVTNAAKAWEKADWYACR